MATKIRAGLYEMRYPIDDENEVIYQIERNDGKWNAPDGDWFVRTEIGYQSDLSTEGYPTKRAALLVVEEMAGNWSHHPSLGWCWNG